MGCDIHLFVERFVNCKWESADTWSPDESTEQKKHLRVAYENSFYCARNYNLFAILADVRNGSGFARRDTGDFFVPISEPRGMPSDATDLVRAESDRWADDGHSHSWFTVEELLSYDWTQTSAHRAYVDAPEYFRWNQWDRLRGESPRTFFGGTNQRVVTETEMIAILTPYGKDWDAEKRIAAEVGSVYCQIEWKQPYYKAVRSFFSDTMPRLWQLGKPEDVRIVFWFDN